MSSESLSQTALASLHETYTDSEEEVELDTEETSRDKFLTPSQESTPSSMEDSSRDKQPQLKLVSYATEDMDDEEMSDLEFSPDLQEDSSDSRIVASEVPPLSPVTFHRRLLNLKKNEIQLPPEPKGRCSMSLQEKISELYEKKKMGKDMNASIQKRKDFRNPSIYEKLVNFSKIDEQGTNYPPETYDPQCWGPESFWEELDKRQQEVMHKIKERNERTKVKFMSGTAKKTSDTTADGMKRKSKWDTGFNLMPAAALRPATLITPNVLQVPTGTKPTVISAYGTISKKAKQ